MVRCACVRLLLGGFRQGKTAEGPWQGLLRPSEVRIPRALRRAGSSVLPTSLLSIRRACNQWRSTWGQKVPRR